MKAMAHFDKFLVDVGLLIGQNILHLSCSDIEFIYRKTLHAITFRFESDLDFIELDQIESPFDLLQLHNACDKSLDMPERVET